MDFFIFFGIVIRWILVYGCDNKKRKASYESNPSSEKRENILVGFIGTIVLFLLIVLILILTGNVSVPRDTIEEEIK